MRRGFKHFTASAMLALATIGAPAAAQVSTEAPPVVEGAAPVRVEHHVVHSREIAGNLLGTSAERDVFVVLPPGYDSHPEKRYPVVYALHGYSIGAEQWMGEIHMPQTAEGAFAKGVPEMILVFPSSKNEHNGAFYSNSATTGNFENFIADELVDWVDANFRTFAQPASRGLVGHSMGGYGASRIGIRRNDRYGALYLMSPCCQSAMGSRGLSAEDVTAIYTLPSAEAGADMSFNLRGAMAIASAFSPNPQHPPLYIDLPVDDEGAERPDIMAKWAANAPLAFVDQYIEGLRGYKAIAMDVGNADGLVADTTRMHEALSAYGIVNSLEVYEGDHTNRLAFRIEDHVLPFFGANLAFEEDK
ncbi:MAG: esterase [Sphingomonadales bacterium 32-64-17]|nr:MAG: esterase [Sphingomonadales bacterium 32-64-17]